MVPMSEELEWQTRKQRIDPRLRAAGWEPAPFEPGKPLESYNRNAIEEYPTENGPADYALTSDGRVLGIAEAKKLSLGPQNVLTQAERYSKGVTDSPFNFDGFRVPFLYSTNGEVILVPRRSSQVEPVPPAEAIPYASRPRRATDTGLRGRLRPARCTRERPSVAQAVPSRSQRRNRAGHPPT